MPQGNLLVDRSPESNVGESETFSESVDAVE